MWYEVENGEGVSAIKANLMVTEDEGRPLCAS